MNLISSLSKRQLVINDIMPKLNAAKILKASTVVAPIFLTLQILGSIPAAEAGFICYTLCMSTCTAATGGAFIPACIAACIATCSTNPV